MIKFYVKRGEDREAVDQAVELLKNKGGEIKSNKVLKMLVRMIPRDMKNEIRIVADDCNYYPDDVDTMLQIGDDFTASELTISLPSPDEVRSLLLGQ